MIIDIQGTVAHEFEKVRDEFAAITAEEAEPGAQLAVFADGRQVVDLWAGDSVTGDSLHALYSSGKGAAYLVVALLVQDGVHAAVDEPRTGHVDRPRLEVGVQVGERVRGAA